MTLRARTLRNTLFSSLAMYTEFALGMLTSILIARHLGPEGFGSYSAVIWLVGMGVAAANSGTASAAIKFVAELRGADRGHLVRPLVAYLRRAQRVYVAIVLALGALALWIAGHRVAPDFHHGLLFGFLAVAISLRAGYMFNIGIAKGLENFRINAMVALVSTPLNLAMVFAVMSTDLTDGMMAATVQGGEITIDLDNGVMINDANVVSADITASNGVIHAIDKVLLPK